jgi:hypothetical protein
VSTDRVHGPTRVLRKPEGDYGIVHPLHCRCAGYRRTSLVPCGIHPDSQTKAQNHWLLLRVENNDTSTTRQRKQTIIAFPDRLSLPQQASVARFRKFGSLNLLILAGLATLLASSTASPNLSRMTSVIFYSNSEIQKTMFLELSKMLVQHDSSPNRNLTLNHHTDWLWSRPGGQDLGQFCRKAGFINEKIVHD